MNKKEHEHKWGTYQRPPETRRDILTRLQIARSELDAAIGEIQGERLSAGEPLMTEIEALRRKLDIGQNAMFKLLGLPAKTWSFYWRGLRRFGAARREGIVAKLVELRAAALARETSAQNIQETSEEKQ